MAPRGRWSRCRGSTWSRDPHADLAAAEASLQEAVLALRGVPPGPRRRARAPGPGGGPAGGHNAPGRCYGPGTSEVLARAASGARRCAGSTRARRGPGPGRGARRPPGRGGGRRGRPAPGARGGGTAAGRRRPRRAGRPRDGPRRAADRAGGGRGRGAGRLVRDLAARQPGLPEAAGRDGLGRRAVAGAAGAPRCRGGAGRRHLGARRGRRGHRRRHGGAVARLAHSPRGGRPWSSPTTPRSPRRPTPITAWSRAWTRAAGDGVHRARGGRRPDRRARRMLGATSADARRRRHAEELLSRRATSKEGALHEPPALGRDHDPVGAAPQPRAPQHDRVGPGPAAGRARRRGAWVTAWKEPRARRRAQSCRG